MNRWFRRFFSLFLCRRLSFLHFCSFSPHFHPILTPFSPPILHNFWLMVAPVHVHVIRYICVQVLACDTEHGCQLKAETDSGHAHCRRPVFQCNTYRSSASESHTYGQLSTISRSSTWTLDKGWVGGGVALHTGGSSMLSKTKLVTLEAAWLILREKYFVSKGGGSGGGGWGSNSGRRGPS